MTTKKISPLVAAQQNLWPSDSGKSSLEKAVRQRLNGRYGDLQAFCKAFAPEKTDIFAASPERCVAGEAPALADVVLAYGETAARAWIIAQLQALAAYCGDRAGLTSDQYYQCATSIQTHYSFLTVTDIMLYFNLLKAGRYGCFYGHVDPMRIVHWLQDFLKDRERICARAEALRRNRLLKQPEQRAGHAERPMSRDEYEQWKRDNPELYEANMRLIRARSEEEERRRRRNVAF